MSTSNFGQISDQKVIKPFKCLCRFHLVQTVNIADSVKQLHGPKRVQRLLPSPNPELFPKIVKRKNQQSVCPRQAESQAKVLECKTRQERSQK